MFFCFYTFLFNLGKHNVRKFRSTKCILHFTFRNFIKSLIWQEKLDGAK